MGESESAYFFFEPLVSFLIPLVLLLDSSLQGDHRGGRNHEVEGGIS